MARPQKDPAAEAAKKAERDAKAAEKAAEKAAAKAAADAAKEAEKAAAAAAKAAKGEVVVSERHDEACARKAFDVAYPVNGEVIVDKGFASAELAEAHADRMREAYGL